MSDLLFGRQVEVTVGIPGKQGIKVTALRVQFKITKTSEPEPNKAEIKIFNLSQHSMAICQKKKSVVVLKAGYGKLSDLFVGNVVWSVPSKDGPNVVMNIEGGEGSAAFLNSKVNESFNPGAAPQGVFQKIVSAMGLPVGDSSGLSGASEYTNGHVISGSAANAMTELADRSDAEWSIQNGAIQFVSVNKATSLPAVLLRSDTGLVGSPSQTKQGMKFECLLNAGLVPGRLVQLDAKYVKGFYIVRNVTHQGDTRGGKFISEVEAIAVKKASIGG